MSLFAVSFELEDGSDYADRYKALTEAIEALADTEVWSETTSFYLLTSTKNSVGLKAALLDAVNLQKGDKLLIINISQKRGHAAEGISDKALFNRLMSQRQ
jgi:hypothetical protein